MYAEGGAQAPRITHRMPLPQWIAAVAWAMLSFGGFVAAIYALVWPVAQLEQAMGLPHPVALGIWAFGWALGSGLLALVAGRLVFGEWLEVRPAAWPIRSAERWSAPRP